MSRLKNIGSPKPKPSGGKVKVVTQDERDLCIELLNGDSSCYLPTIHRIVKDKSSLVSKHQLVVEDIDLEDVIVVNFLTILQSADSVALYTNKEKRKTSVLLTYYYGDHAVEIQQLIGTLLPNAKVYKSSDCLKDQYKAMASSLADDNRYLTVADEAKELTALISVEPTGIILNNLPATITERDLSVRFTTAHRCWIPTEWIVHTDQHRYAFVEYGSQQEVDEALANLGNEYTLDGSTIECLNYGELHEAINKDMDDPIGDLGLSDKSREYLIKFVGVQLGALRFIHDVIMRARATLEGLTARQRKDMTQRRKFVCRKIHRCIKVIKKDTERRRKNGLPNPDTAEQMRVVNTAYTEGHKVVTKEIFEGFLVKKPPPEPKKRVLTPNTSSTGPLAKYPRVDLKPTGSSYMGSSRGRGQSSMRGSTPRGGSMRGGSSRGGSTRGMSSSRGGSMRGGSTRGGTSRGRGGMSSSRGRGTSSERGFSFGSNSSRSPRGGGRGRGSSYGGRGTNNGFGSSGFGSSRGNKAASGYKHGSSTDRIQPLLGRPASRPNLGTTYKQDLYHDRGDMDYEHQPAYPAYNNQPQPVYEFESTSYDYKSPSSNNYNQSYSNYDTSYNDDYNRGSYQETGYNEPPLPPPMDPPPLPPADITQPADAVRMVMEMKKQLNDMTYLFQ